VRPGHGSAERRHPVTIATVAQLAGVSKATVSNVLTGNRPVATATRQRVRRAIADLDYQPDGAAQALRLKKSHTVALIVPDLTNPFFSAVARGLQETVMASGYLTFVAASASVRETELALLAECARRRVDAVVIAAFALRSEEFERLQVADIPVVGIGRQLSGEGLDIVSADDHRMALDAVQYLFDRGHRRIATVTGPSASAVAQQRLSGFRAACSQLGLGSSDDVVGEGDWTREGGRAATRKLLGTDERPTAVYVANDLMAIGVMDVAREAGLHIPGDLAIVGTDDIEVASLVSPQLTTIHIPTVEIGRTAGRLLMDRIEGHSERPRRTVLIAHSLVSRETA
jgi:LacI family transcriptional regulator